MVGDTYECIEGFDWWEPFIWVLAPLLITAIIIWAVISAPSDNNKEYCHNYISGADHRPALCLDGDNNGNNN